MVYTLEELGYSYDALEPNFDEQIMHLHHDKHHAAYVDKLNSLLKEGGIQADLPLESLVKNVDFVLGSADLVERIKFNVGGHYNHDLLWKIMTPGGSNTPSGLLKDAIARTFGGLDELKSQIEKSALSHLGAGWTWLCIDKKKHDELFVCSTINHDNPWMRNCVERIGYPILALDLWEHAYYLKYNNRKAEYIEAYWRVINWDVVSDRFEKHIEK